MINAEIKLNFIAIICDWREIWLYIYTYICVLSYLCMPLYLPYLCTFNVIICGCYFLFISSFIHSHITLHFCQLLGFTNNICIIFGDAGIYHCGSLWEPNENNNVINSITQLFMHAWLFVFFFFLHLVYILALPFLF